MLGFHRRTRSLIPVKDLAKYDKIPQIIVTQVEEEEMELGYGEGIEEVSNSKARGRQLTLVYVMLLVEAIMASSLQPQLQMLMDSDENCGSLYNSYLGSILDCAFAFGGTAGIFWGYLSDRIGRRRVALLGLWSMFACCLSMGLATHLATCAIFRFAAGLASSAVIVTTITMIGDLSGNVGERAKNVAQLPLVALCGSVGPAIQSLIPGEGEVKAIGSQIACGSILLMVAVTASIMLKETLPLQSSQSSDDQEDFDCEKAAFLSSSDSDIPAISVVDFVRPDPISISQFLQAPSFLVLLSSFSLLALHASTFDMLLPQLGHSRTNGSGGMGLSCGWWGLIVLVVRAIAALIILRFASPAVEKFGLLKSYRFVSVSFPIIYIGTFFLAIAALIFSVVSAYIAFPGFIISLFVKHALTDGASVLVILLVLNSTPDAFSAGTVVGMMQIASLFKALAVAVTGAAFYLMDTEYRVDPYGVMNTNFALWACLVLFSGVGAALAWFVRERPSVERDFPSEVLCWETCFDAAAVEGVSQI